MFFFFSPVSSLALWCRLVQHEQTKLGNYAMNALPHCQALELAQTVIGEQDSEVQKTRRTTEKCSYASRHLFDCTSYLCRRHFLACLEPYFLTCFFSSFKRRETFHKISTCFSSLFASGPKSSCVRMQELLKPWELSSQKCLRARKLSYMCLLKWPVLHGDHFLLPAKSASSAVSHWFDKK